MTRNDILNLSQLRAIGGFQRKSQIPRPRTQTAIPRTEGNVTRRVVLCNRALVLKMLAELREIATGLRRGDDSGASDSGGGGLTIAHPTFSTA